MSKKQTYIALASGVFLIALAVFWGIKQPETANAPSVEKFGPSQGDGQQNQSSEIVYYYRYDCSHCAELSKFLDENKIADKVSFLKKEVHDQTNAAEMQKRAGECGIAEKDIGVPFVYGGGKCYIGTLQAEAFFKQELSNL